MRTFFRDICRPGLAAIGTFWKPFLLIQACGLAVVLAYFAHEPFRQIADSIAAYKQAAGLWLAAVCGAIAGTLLPETAKAVAMGQWRVTRQRLNDVGVNLLLFATMGVISDVFFILLKHGLGDGVSFGSVLAKMAIDQLLYTPLLTLPLVALVFTCRAEGWSIPRTFARLDASWYRRRVLPLLLPCWCFWVPITGLMYTLPGALTFCFAMFALGAWNLVAVFVAQQSHAPAARVETPVTLLSPMPAPIDTAA